jgi:hypothetical protein
MRHPFIAWLLGVVFYGCLATLLAAAPADTRVLVTSPDHPRTFWTGGWEPVTHYVQWNEDLGALEGHVTYGTPSYAANWWNPVYYDSFKVKFPGVRLDAKEGRLYVLDAHKHQVTIGHLQPGVFGDRVELEKNVDLDMQRHNGHLDAALVATPQN